MGLGELGQDAARKLQVMGFDVAGWSRSPKAVEGLATFAGSDGMIDFLARTDILVSLLPLTPDTRGLIDAKLLAGLAQGGRLGGPFLINAGRGGLQVEADILPTRDAHGAGRRRVTLHVRYPKTPGGRIEAGFMQARSHALVDLEGCPLLVPALAPAPDIARAIGHILRGLAKPLDVQVTATDSGLDCDIRGSGPLVDGLRQKLIALARGLLERIQRFLNDNGMLPASS